MEYNQTRIIKLPKIFDPRGNLTVVEQHIHIPFSIEGIKWTHGMKNDQRNHGDTLKNYKFFVPLCGSFRITTEENNSQQTFVLTHPDEGLLIVPGCSYTTHDFSKDAVYLELSSAQEHTSSPNDIPSAK